MSYYPNAFDLLREAMIILRNDTSILVKDELADRIERFLEPHIVE